MSIIKERYASAVNSSNLSVKPNTTYSDTDVLAAMGIAAKYHPLGAALQRLFVDGKAQECVNLMTTMARDHSYWIKSRMTLIEAHDTAKAVLAWYRHGICTDCGGTGKEIILEPKPHLSEIDCGSCFGIGRRPFNVNFAPDTLPVALWLKEQIAKHQAMAGSAAMALIAPSLDL